MHPVILPIIFSHSAFHVTPTWLFQVAPFLSVLPTSSLWRTLLIQAEVISVLYSMCLKHSCWLAHPAPRNVLCMIIFLCVSRHWNVLEYINNDHSHLLRTYYLSCFVSLGSMLNISHILPPLILNTDLGNGIIPILLARKQVWRNWQTCPKSLSKWQSWWTQRQCFQSHFCWEKKKPSSFL